VPVLAGLPDIAVISLGTTMGLRQSDEAFADLARGAGATCDVVPMRIGALAHLRRGMLLTDLVEASCAQRSARGVRARAIVYSTVTAALLQRPQAPYGVRFDSPAALNRPGVGGAWQRRRERTVLGAARLLLPWSQAASSAVRALLGDGPPAVVLPPPLDDVESVAERDLDAVAYAANPHKRGLELLCEAWREVAPPGARLVVGGLARDAALRHLRRAGVGEPAGVEWAAALPRDRWLDLVGRARMFVNASRYEEWGLAPMEALAAGTPLVTVPTPGPNDALPLARRLAPQLVAEERSPSALARALRAALALDEEPRAAYAREAAHLLEPYRRAALQRTFAERVLPVLLGGDHQRH
jgi:glycosyltransferase involved in cell wall biosynthesis